jgi:trehalose 6-phosphate phosphatase
MRPEPPVPSSIDCCLFLDIDGTLLDFALTPDQVQVDDALRDLLRALDERCGGALALISGRSIADIDDLFDPLCLAAAGVHGCERRDAQGHLLRPSFDLTALEEFRARLRVAVRPLDGVLIEDKGCGLAAHYRLAPRMGSPLRATVLRLMPLLPPSFEMIEGDFVIEVKPVAHNKATAVEAFMQEPPFTGRIPIFIGDDVTDQDGFAAVRRHSGISIAVGDNTGADWRLPDPAAVQHWLQSLVTGVTA